MCWYWYRFADGYEVCTRMSKEEIKVEEQKHGKLLRKIKESE